MFSTVFSQLVTDPDQILQEKLEEWTEVWKCNDKQARSKACTVIRKAMADALLAGDFDEASGDLRSGGQRVKAAKSFRKGTAVGSDNWPLHEYAKVDPADLDRAGVQAATWKSQCVVPMQYLMNVMSMIPRRRKGIIA